MRSGSVPHSDPCNHSRSLCPNTCPSLLQTSHPPQLRGATAAAWHKGRKRCPLFLSSDWFSSLRSIKEGIPKENSTPVKAAHSHRPWDHQKPVEIHVLPRVSFDIRDLTVLFHHSVSQEREIEKGAATPPDFLHYLCTSLAANMQRQCSLF